MLDLRAFKRLRVSAGDGPTIFEDASVIRNMVSAGLITLIGLLFNVLAGLFIVGFDFRPINRVGQLFWPKHKKLVNPSEKLRNQNKIKSDVYGFEVFASRIAPLDEIQDNIGRKIGPENLEYESMTLENPDGYLNDDSEVKVQIVNTGDSLHSIDYSTEIRMDWPSSVNVINQELEQGFLHAGVALLIFGFLLQAYAQFSRITSFDLFYCF